MADQVIIYSRTGLPLGEISASVTRAWALERTLRPERAIVAVKAANVSPELMRYRNFLHVKSSITENWVGWFGTPRRWRSGVIYATAYSAEYLTRLRVCPSSGEMTNGATALFGALMRECQKEEGLLIDSTDPQGGTNKNHTIEFRRQSYFDALNEIAASTQNYWWIDPVVKANNRLTLRARISRQRGATFERPLVEGTNLTNVVIDEIQESDMMVNKVIVEGYTESAEDPLSETQYNHDSGSAYGLSEDVISGINIVDPYTLYNAASAELAKRAFPRTRLEADVELGALPKIGERITAQVSSVLYSGEAINAGVGKTITLRIKNAAYNPANETRLHIVADNIFWE